VSFGIAIGHTNISTRWTLTRPPPGFWPPLARVVLLRSAGGARAGGGVERGAPGVSGMDSPRLAPRSPMDGSALVLRQHRDNPRHRGPVIAVLVLDAAVRSRSDGLVEAVEVRVETAVVDEHPGVVEMQDEGPTDLEQMIGPLMACGVERVVAHHGVIVLIAVRPPHRVTGVDGHGEGRETVLRRD